MADLKDLQPGDRVRVTRRGHTGSLSQWEGTLVKVHPDTGFQLDGHRLGTGEPERGHFATAESLRRWAKCEQTVELLERPER